MSTLYVSDLDGTLLRSNQRTSDYTNAAVNRLTGRGMHFSYATARSFETARKVTAGLTAHIPVIVYNGAFIIDNVTGARLASNFFGPMAGEILSDLLRHEVYPIVYSFIDGAEKFSYVPTHVSPGMKKFLDSRKGDRRDHPVADISGLGAGDVFYFTCIDAAAKLDPLYAKCRSLCRCVRHTDPYTQEPWLELMPRQASKASAVRQLAKLLDCRRIVAFGDGVNDIDLFQAADECYVVANAAEELKAIATGIIGSNDEDAVAHWLEERDEGRGAAPAPCQRALHPLDSL